MREPREQRYWRIKPAPKPGDEVARHDGGVGLDENMGGIDAHYVSGPGNYQVIVERARSLAAGQTVTDRWPIVLINARGERIASFNRGMARWFGLRLIEAAALCEVFDVEGGASKSMATSEVDRLATWLEDNAADKIMGSAVDTAIAIMGEYKKAINAGEVIPPTPTERAIEELRREFKRAVDDQRVPVTLRAREARSQVLQAGTLTQVQIDTDVIGWFSPNDQATLRGLGLG